MRKEKDGNCVLRLLEKRSFGVRGELAVIRGHFSFHIHFPGKSLEFIPVGTNHVKIGDDHYQW